MLEKGHCNVVIVAGGTYGEHVCDCHYEAGGCVEEETRHNTCNCDANLPAELSDTGTITNTSALPVVKLFFGGMTFDLQYGAFQLGRLKCYGGWVNLIAASLIYTKIINNSRGT